MRDKVIMHFDRSDPVMAGLVKAGFSFDPPLRLRNPAPADKYFEELAASIVEQQLSLKAADAIWQRFVALMQNDVTPERVARLDLDQLRTAGISRQKGSYLLSIAENVASKEINLETMPDLSDREVIEELTKLKGVGPWTAEMFLIFTLGRPDVFSLGDLGLQMSIKEHYGEMTLFEIEELSARWSPYRSYAALALWHARDNSPS